MDADDVMYEGDRFRVVRRRYATADGRKHRRDVIVHPGAVTIVPLLADGRVCLIRNYRAAVGETLYELPAGTLEPDEPPLETARRELIEETGFSAATMRPLGQLWMSPGVMCERMHLFLATELQAGEMQLEAGEQIERAIVAWDEALAMIDDGRIVDAKTVAALLRFDRLRRAEPRLGAP